MTNKLKIQLDISKEMDLESVPFMLIARLAAQMGAYLDMSGGRLRVVQSKPEHHEGAPEWRAEG